MSTSQAIALVLVDLQTAAFDGLAIPPVHGADLLVRNVRSQSEPSGQGRAFGDTMVAAHTLRITLISMEARNREELEAVLVVLGKERPQALLELVDPLTFFWRLPALRSSRQARALRRLPPTWPPGVGTTTRPCGWCAARTSNQRGSSAS